MTHRRPDETRFLELCSIDSRGRVFDFLLDSQQDHIQNVLRRGGFYELEELQLMQRLAPEAKRILDIGANIGNHSIYFAHHFDAERVVPVEPNPRVIPLLKANLGLNWHPAFDFGCVGMGFSDHAGRGDSVVASETNLGGAKLVENDSGNVRILPADDALREASFDLIKIDAEGMELAVLSGMSGILRRSRAVVFVECTFDSIDGVIALLEPYGYEYRTSYQRYGRCINLAFGKMPE